ncbi:SYVC [Enterospora canceri]|uniref:valine--tRNA ligase n=1 Tax=Enterospora canceri TaxID=1081671 RepID=A0A1Y1S4T7_9MICR|nr:SYVC [Enterospora canceri]
MTAYSDMKQQKPKLTKEEKKALKEKQIAEKLERLARKKDLTTKQTDKQKKKETKKCGGYDPAEVEAKWTKFWLENETFKCKVNSDKELDNFCMIIPPPNITGSLHIGHAMMIAIEDAIVRYNRQNGKNVLYLPGLDHAGISTQSVVMKKIAREDSNKLQDREYFMATAHEWSNKYGSRIIEQFNRMGSSLDFSKQMFTLDPRVSNSVKKAFIILYNKGLIYRENKMVNWSGQMQTTLSDLEVNYKTVSGGEELTMDGKKHQFGLMYYVKYFIAEKKNKKMLDEKIQQIRKKFKDESMKNNYMLHNAMNDEIYSTLPHIIVGTTRPETILGDTAICMNPEDKRMKNIKRIFERLEVEDVMNDENRTTKHTKEEVETDLNTSMKKEKRNKYKVVGQEDNETGPNVSDDLIAINPLTYELIPVVFDKQADLTLGTGMLKITPAHDMVDFKLGQKHGLKFITVIDQKNRICYNSPYKGMKRFEARELVKEHPCILKVEEYDQILPFCSRSNDLVEPILKEQWWLNCDEMAAQALDAVEQGEIKLFPEESKAIWSRWLINIKDWCLSRQLWWGHRIPAYFYKKNDKTEWIVAESIDEARKLVREKEGTEMELEQDGDVLDTWFSSGLWPFSTLGWEWGEKDNSELLKQFFPNSILETGSDILFFWVARMVMLSYALLGTKPFDTILLHGIVRDAHGQKMSKSLGNVIDPIYVIEGVTQDEMIQNISVNVSKNEMERAKESIILDYPNGIPKCGADALRFSLLSYTNGMKDINLDILRVAGYSRLCNKIHNAFKYVESKLTKMHKSVDDCEKMETFGELMAHNKHILNQLNDCIAQQHKNYVTYNFMGVTQSLHMFVLYSFCDVHIELSKAFETETDLNVLVYVFLAFIKLLHPTMPFISQEIYCQLHQSNRIISDFPKRVKQELASDFASVLDAAKSIRGSNKATVSKHAEYLRILCKETKIDEDGDNTEFSFTI